MIISPQDLSFIYHLDFLNDFLPLFNIYGALPAYLGPASVHALLLVLFGDLFGLAILLKLGYFAIVEDFLHEGWLGRFDVLHLDLHSIKLLVINLLCSHILIQHLHMIDTTHLLDSAVRNNTLQLLRYILLEVLFARNQTHGTLTGG